MGYSWGGVVFSAERPPVVDAVMRCCTMSREKQSTPSIKALLS